MAGVPPSCAFLKVTCLISACVAHERKVKPAKKEQKFQVLTSRSQISLLPFVN